MSPRPDLVLLNARVITLNDRQPSADAVAVQGGRIVWVGARSEMPTASSRARVIDCQGQTLIPGFNDAHCHVLAYASSLLALDCSPSAVRSIADIKRALAERASRTPTGQWVRAVGYDESALADGRHPTRRDLDEAAPSHPVRLNHRSGHACVLNSAALAQVGITAFTPEPPGAVIERDFRAGEPTGLLIEMDDYLDSRIPPLSEQELRRGAALASQRFVSLGVTSVQDATPSNSPDRWDAFAKLKEDAIFKPRVTLMAGAGHLRGFLDRGMRFGSGDSGLSLGAVKIMLTMTAGALQPPQEELEELVRRAQDAGFQVAIHAVETEAVEAAAGALLACKSAASKGLRHRIEHCAECPPAALDKLKRAGAVIVTQPGFLYYSGRRYLADVPKDVQPWLYRMTSFLRVGLAVAASSDAPVIDPNPLVGIYSAVTRRASTGQVVGEPLGVSVEEALRMYTLAGAYAAFQEADRGAIQIGKLADFALLDRNPMSADVEQLTSIKVTLTLIGGQMAWEA